MFNVGEDRLIPQRYVVGVARNKQGTLQEWKNIGSYPSTDWSHLGVSRVESPLVIQDSLSGAWRMFVANANYDALGHLSTYFLTQAPGDSVTNRAVSAWPQRDSLYAYTGNDVDVIGWQACEHLQIGPVHYFAAYVGPDGIGITRMHWSPSQQKFVFVYPTNAGVGASGRAGDAHIYLSEYRPRAGVVRMVVESGQSFIPDLTIYDLAGRRVRRIGDRRRLDGRREYSWDCRSEDGARVPTGTYFARLTGSASPAVLRVAIVR
jgi:hypothetical protein